MDLDEARTMRITMEEYIEACYEKGDMDGWRKWRNRDIVLRKYLEIEAAAAGEDDTGKEAVTDAVTSVVEEAAADAATATAIELPVS